MGCRSSRTMRPPTASPGPRCCSCFGRFFLNANALPRRHAPPPLHPRAAVGDDAPRQQAAALRQALLHLVADEREGAPVGDPALRDTATAAEAAASRHAAIRS